MNISGPTYVYKGPGAWDVDVDQSVRMLEGIEDSAGVKIFDARSIKCVENVDELDSRTRLLVIPGGSMPTMGLRYFDSCRQKVIDYVQGGGKYLGICAGGLLATSYIGGKPSPYMNAFSDEKLERLKREGKLYTAKHMNYKSPSGFYLYDGQAIAPHIVKNLNAANPENLCSVGVEMEIDGVAKVFKTFHYSGPVFLDPPSGSEVLLRYSDHMELFDYETLYISSTGGYEHYLTGKSIDIEKPVAALACKAGEGRMVLTGVHPEIDPMTYSEDAKKYHFEVTELPGDLSMYNRERNAVLTSIFKSLYLI